MLSLVLRSTYLASLSSVTSDHSSLLDLGLGVVSNAYGLLTSSLYCQHLTAPIAPIASSLSLYRGHKNSGCFRARFGIELPLSEKLTWEIISITSSLTRFTSNADPAKAYEITLDAFSFVLSVLKYFLSSASCNKAASCNAKHRSSLILI